jgi:putative membrane protein
MGYGIFAALILIVGFSRAILAAKGWDYHAHNAFFWAKIAIFLVIGLLSVPPTIVYVKWRRGDAVTDEAIATTRRYLDGSGTVSVAVSFRGSNGSRIWHVLTDHPR